MNYGKGKKQRKATIPFRYFLRGSCMMGNACDYLHETKKREWEADKEAEWEADEEAEDQKTKWEADEEAEKKQTKEAAVAAKKEETEEQGEEAREAAKAAEMEAHQDKGKQKTCEPRNPTHGRRGGSKLRPQL